MALARTSDSLIGDIIKIIIAVFLPPLAVALEVGLGKHFWINLILVLFFFVPAVIHAVYIVATR
jgi:uncharacterized membrane protein YqaE (UPF0057 family)